MFKHALTRDVAYESVLLERRLQMHCAVGRAIETLYPDRLPEYYETLADHFTLGEDWPRAFHYHDLAAAKATATYANQSAVEHCRKALEIAERLGDAVRDAKRARLHVRLGAAASALSDFVTSGEAYERGARLATSPDPTARNLARSAYAFLWGHRYERAGELVDEAEAVAAEHDLPAARSLAVATRDEQELVLRGQLDSPHGDRALVLAERAEDPEALSMVYTQIGMRAEWAGDYPRAIHFARRGLEIARRARLGNLVTMPEWALGLALTCTGRYDQAIGQFRQALEHCERLGDRAVTARLLNTLGFCHAEIGCHAEAAELNRRGERLGAEMVELGLVAGAPELFANGAANLAGNHIALGELDEALEHLEPLRLHLEKDDDPWMRWRYAMHVADAMARWHLARGEPERALELATDECAAARHHGTRKLEARALELMGRTLLHLDRRDDARREVAAAAALAGEIGYPPVRWRALSLSAELARRAGDRGRADREAREARVLVEDLARGLSDRTLQMRFGSLGEALAVDPLGAYR
jgi:tetratricopeptide (TPR) repeat protein